MAFRRGGQVREIELCLVYALSTQAETSEMIH